MNTSICLLAWFISGAIMACIVIWPFIDRLATNSAAKGFSRNNPTETVYIYRIGRTRYRARLFKDKYEGKGKIVYIYRKGHKEKFNGN